MASGPRRARWSAEMLASACPPVIDITACDVDRCYTHPGHVCLLTQGACRPVGAQVSAEHIHAGRRLGPEGEGARLSGADYGSTVWLGSADPVDPEFALWGGLFGQCAIASARHNAVVVSMGFDLIGEGCGVSVAACLNGQVVVQSGLTDARW
jgi:hypothetical protein